MMILKWISGDAKDKIRNLMGLTPIENKKSNCVTFGYVQKPHAETHVKRTDIPVVHGIARKSGMSNKLEIKVTDYIILYLSKMKIKNSCTILQNLRSMLSYCC